MTVTAFVLLLSVAVPLLCSLVHVHHPRLTGPLPSPPTPLPPRPNPLFPRPTPLPPRPTAFFAPAQQPGTQATSLRMPVASPSTHQANEARVRPTVNAHMHQSLPWCLRPTYNIDIVAIHNHVNHLAWHNTALFVKPWPPTNINFDLSCQQTFVTTDTLENNPPCAAPPTAPSSVPMLSALRPVSSVAPFQHPVGSSFSARGTAARLSKPPRTPTPSASILSGWPLITNTNIVLTKSPGRNLE